MSRCPGNNANNANKPKILNVVVAVIHLSKLRASHFHKLITKPLRQAQGKSSLRVKQKANAATVEVNPKREIFLGGG
jgi:hypothetical protein